LRTLAHLGTEVNDSPNNLDLQRRPLPILGTLDILVKMLKDLCEWKQISNTKVC